MAGRQPSSRGPGHGPLLGQLISLSVGHDACCGLCGGARHPIHGRSVSLSSLCQAVPGLPVHCPEHQHGSGAWRRLVHAQNAGNLDCLPPHLHLNYLGCWDDSASPSQMCSFGGGQGYAACVSILDIQQRWQGRGPCCLLRRVESR